MKINTRKETELLEVMIDLPYNDGILRITHPRRVTEEGFNLAYEKMRDDVLFMTIDYVVMSGYIVQFFTK